MRLVWAAVASLLAIPAHAGTTTYENYVTGLPAATTPLSGSELIAIIQGGAAKSITQSNLAGTPRGLNTQLQYNNSGAFGGVSGVTSNGTTLTVNSGDLLLAGSGSGTTTLNASATASGVLTLPAATDTLIGRATTDTLTNKTYDTAGAGNVFKINGTSITGISGNTATVGSTSGAFVSGNCVKTDASHNLVDAAAACGGSPGGSNTDVQFNNSSAFGGDSGFTYAGSGQATLALGTITTNLKALSITGTWNNSGTTFDAPLFMNITNTASASGSYLMDLQLSGNRQMSLSYTSVPILNIWNSAGMTVEAQMNGAGQIYANANIAVVDNAGTPSTYYWIGRNTNFYLGNSLPFGWGSSPASGAQTVLSRIADGDMMLSNSTSATKLLVSSTTDSTTSRTNYADAYLQAGVNAGEFDLGSEHGGTGTALTKLGVFIDGTNKADYAVTNAAAWTFAAPIWVPSLPTGTPATYACFTSGGELVSSATAC